MLNTSVTEWYALLKSPMTYLLHMLQLFVIQTAREVGTGVRALQLESCNVMYPCSVFLVLIVP